MIVPTIADAPIGVAAFAGPTAHGPDGGAPELVDSYAAFESRFGTPPMATADDPVTVFAAAVRAFFDNGGRRLHVARASGSDADAYRAALDRIGAVPEVTLVAAPAGGLLPWEEHLRLQRLLIEHARRPGACRFALLDAPRGAGPEAVVALRAAIGSTRAALFYPWPLAAPVADGEAPLAVSPCGAVAGLYARNDAERGVWRAAAGLPLRGMVGLERELDAATRDRLGADGINCLRALPGSAPVVWGGRTVSGDPDWKYVPVRRFILFLEQSIASGLQWAVFEPNDERLWQRVRGSVEGFLQRQWQAGAIQGQRTDQAFAVRCDRTTMTHEDVAQGRLVCVVSVAPVRPGEFVVFSIRQKTHPW